MELNFNVSGEERKRLVTVLAEYLNCKAQYLGVPSCAYRVGDFIVGKTGIISFDEHLTDEKFIAQLTDKLESEGFQTENNSIGLTIQLPMLDDMALANLYALIESKGYLIKKALGVEELPVLKNGDKLEFLWFKNNHSPDEVKTYMHFVTALCDMAKNQKRINAKEKIVENEKYAFRCFLLRLGFIGNEYKTERKILLSNLSGSSAFKSGSKKEADDDISR